MYAFFLINMFYNSLCINFTDLFYSLEIFIHCEVGFG